MISLRFWTSICRPFIRLSSSSAVPQLPKSQQKVVVADGGRTIVCWHPEEPFPYEFTQPLPEEPVIKETTILKDLDMRFSNKSQEEVRNTLMKMTFTTKHYWFGKSRLKRNKPKVRDREYL